MRVLTHQIFLLGASLLAGERRKRDYIVERVRIVEHHKVRIVENTAYLGLEVAFTNSLTCLPLLEAAVRSGSVETRSRLQFQKQRFA